MDGIATSHSAIAGMAAGAGVLVRAVAMAAVVHVGRMGVGNPLIGMAGKQGASPYSVGHHLAGASRRLCLHYQEAAIIREQGAPVAVPVAALDAASAEGALYTYLVKEATLTVMAAIRYLQKCSSCQLLLGVPHRKIRSLQCIGCHGRGGGFCPVRRFAAKNTQVSW